MNHYMFTLCLRLLRLSALRQMIFAGNTQAVTSTFHLSHEGCSPFPMKPEHIGLPFLLSINSPNTPESQTTNVSLTLGRSLVTVLAKAFKYLV